MKSASMFLYVAGLAFAQAPQAANPTQQGVVGPDPGQPVPIFRVNVVARTTKAINYHHRSGATNIDFRGTELMPEARGQAKVESKQGVIKIDAEMEKLQPATRYGPEYLTYVMWAITPEGRATNIGEVLLNGGTKSHLNATSELQSFGLIVTAEPYFAVTQPSDVVVMENFVRHDTTGTIEDVDAKFELLKRGQYTLNASAAELRNPWVDRKTPIELQEARNAVQIARWTGAEKYASDTYQKAVIGLQNAEGYLVGKGGKKPIGTVAREAVQMAEDARIITLKKMEEEQLAAERAAAANREAKAKANAEEQTRLAQLETQRRTQAESERAAAAEREARARIDSEVSARNAQLETQRRAQAEADRQAAQTAKLEAEKAQQEAIRLRGEAEAAKAAAIAEQQTAQAEAAKARAAYEDSNAKLQKSENEREQMRAQLLQQLNLILETRDTARGLIVNLSDVLFDTAQFTLRPGAREKLAKISGIVLAHPGLRLEVEGHTDSVGGDEYNQRLSEQRATSTRDYLVQQGVVSNTITARGFGKTMPVASNDTAAGRQRNRRVELVVSGDVIGGAKLSSNPVDSNRSPQ